MSKVTKSARDKPCTLRITGVCNGNPATTVLCHLDSEFKGISFKSPDYLGVYGCFDCHQALDQHKIPKAERAEYQLRALQRTLKIMFDEGTLCVG